MNAVEYHAVKFEVEYFINSCRFLTDFHYGFELVYRIEDETIYIAEVRAVGQGGAENERELPVAQISFVASKNVWRLYWMHDNFNWELYEETPMLEVAFQLIRVDQFGCFYN